MEKTARTMLLFALISGLLCNVARAQVGGRITGFVKDSNGAIIPGARVVIRNAGAGFRQETTTDAQGSYTFPMLAAGNYEIEIDFQGFRPYQRRGLVLDISTTLQVDATLQPAGQEETVTVTAVEAARVETGDTQLNGQGVDLPDLAAGSLQINHDPRNGKSYFNTSLFSVPALGTPGTSPRRFFYGPGINNWDIALLKTTKLNESKAVELRFETFNTFNHAQFFGSSSVDGNVGSSTFGRVVSAAPPRLMQVAVKLAF